MPPIEVFEAGDLLWALRQGKQWYLVSTEGCQVQDWDNPDGRAPGPVFGRFEQREAGVVFTLVSAR
jgi:hypothetical protein